MVWIMSFDELIKNDYDLVYWHKTEIISYHIIYHLCKYVGFDLLSFTPLDDAIFDPRNETKFFRFHFRAMPFRKMSSHVWDILLTSKSFEPVYHSVFKSTSPPVSEAFFQGISDTFVDLVNLKDENSSIVEIDYDILIDTLSKYFGSAAYEPLRQWEKQGSSIVNSIKTLNEWRIKLKNHGYEQFLKDCFEKAYKNHFKQIKGLKLTNALATQQDVDLLNEIYQNTKFKFRLK